MYMSSDIDDMRLLTPSQFLCSFRITTLPEIKQVCTVEDEEFMLKEAMKKDLIIRVNYLEKLMKSLWLRWHRDYLTSLRQR